MHEILIIADFFGLPHEGYLFQRLKLDACAWDSLWEDIEDIVSVLLIIKSKVIWFIGDYFEANISEFITTLEKFTNFIDLYFIYWFGWYVMERLKVHFFAGDEDIAINVVEGEDSSGEDIGLLNNWFFRDTFD